MSKISELKREKMGAARRQFHDEEIHKMEPAFY
jgi:hypothetical protein